jgi:hypothetical protein
MELTARITASIRQSTQPRPKHHLPRRHTHYTLWSPYPPTVKRALPNQRSQRQLQRPLGRAPPSDKRIKVRPLVRQLQYDNENVRNIGQGEARHRKYKRLKLGGGHAYDRSSD